MKITAIEFAGEFQMNETGAVLPQAFARAQRRGETLEVEVSKRDGTRRRVVGLPADTGILRELAAWLQHEVDGYEGSAGHIDAYHREIERLASSEPGTPSAE